MGNIVSDVFGSTIAGQIFPDPLGIESAQEATSEAARIQAEAAAAGQAEISRQFDITQAGLVEAQEFQREQSRPFQEAGVAAIGQQQALLGLSGPEAERAAVGRIEESSGQQFLRKRQERSLLRNASAIGGLGGGNVRTALQEQAVGFAQQDIQNQFGRLGQLSGQGQVAATNVGQGALTTAGQIGQFGAQTATNVSNLGIAGAEARASGVLGRTQAETQATNQLLQLGGQFAGFI